MAPKRIFYFPMVLAQRQLRQQCGRKAVYTFAAGFSISPNMPFFKGVSYFRRGLFLACFPENKPKTALAGKKS